MRREIFLSRHSGTSGCIQPLNSNVRLPEEDAILTFLSTQLEFSLYVIGYRPGKGESYGFKLDIL